MENIIIHRYQSPAGCMIIGSHQGKICICDWANGKSRERKDRRICSNLHAEYEKGLTDVVRQTENQLNEYFSGKRKEFTVPIKFSGSDFQCHVWEELMKIPYGVTVSYGEIANRIKNPQAARAVASASASNPISIIVPCHRVVGSDNKLTGYDGGLVVKQFLLNLETNNSDIFKLSIDCKNNC